MEYHNQVELSVFISMDSKNPAFRGMSITQVQHEFILGVLPMRGYLSNFDRSNLNPYTTLVLFHYKSSVIASAIFVRQEEIIHEKYRFACYFGTSSITIYQDPITIEDLQKVSARFTRFQSYMPYINREDVPALLILLARKNPHRANEIDNDAADEFVLVVERGIQEIPKTEREQIIRSRIGQSLFRDRLLKQRQRCDLCPVSNLNVLTASHIKEWSCCESNFERLDPENGLLLCPNHDRLFDRKLISFEDDGTIIISTKLTEDDQKFLNIDRYRRIDLSGRKRVYMALHRQALGQSE
ncbi:MULTISPECIES: HNH endonuclease [unclassified Paenibacillus]|uniref:HNH endonuclease n=1 Tax=unclassified Paenibacillus TaxID=185978 RepID=UPI00277D48A0|nr:MULTISPECIES: HNH endonuclease signature motif containing protein [unclassified Paenibacillus]MDQ0896314.1 hypothetical protein [Paenibacillus sp. V4I7]MDQ0913759.1 hypothetical protein [Paenibacillus sp. V4I5]